MRSFAVACCAFFVLTSLAVAQTDDDLINPDRPGIADGSSSINRGTLQIEAGAERDQTHAGGFTERTLSTPLLLRYGLGRGLELRIETLSGYETVHAEAGSESGFSPVSIGAKWHFLDGDDKTRRPSLGFIGRVFLPSGSGDFRSSHASFDLRLAADDNLSEKWAINPNVGIEHDDQQGRETFALAALTLQYNLSQRWNIFVDGGLQSGISGGGGTSLLLDSGTACVIGRDLQLDFSIGWGARGDSVPNVFWAAGISRRFR
jgi:hypothetical protein